MRVGLVRRTRLIIASFVLLAAARASSAQTVAIVNVSLIPMDRERVEARQTVLVRGDRIVSIGAAADVAVPADATIVDGAGRYLLPGLVDAHVHLLGFGPGPRDNFADGPIYLANGITTVVSLGGPDTPRRATELEWKRRVDRGEMIGPTIYTAGAFVNEPRVTTPDEVERDVRSQARAGYDLIKFHELDNTTAGLSLPSYRRMIDTARDVGIPLIGHAPNNLGIDALLDARQPLAHLGNLSNLYFLPLAAHRGTLLLTATGFFLLIAAAALSGAPPLSRAIAFFTFTAFVCLSLFLPGGPLFESLALRIAVTALTGLVALASLMSIIVTLKLWRDPRSSTSANVRASAALVASVTLAIVLTTFWTPIAWRSSTRGIDALAARLHDAGIVVQSTLTVYEAIGGLNRFYRLPAFNMKVARALHRAGVTIVAGTDARGIPQLPPGTSLHRELQLLRESGLSPYEVIRAATVAPAMFLRKANEFGTVAVGRRADLLLVDRNPFEDLATLKTPLGVMARGRWFPHGQAKQE
jgi:imidazolonepropionase-like amidohydrolase